MENINFLLRWILFILLEKSADSTAEENSGGRFANHQSVSRNAQFRRSDFRYSGAIGGSFFSVFCCELCVEKKVVRRAKSLHRSSHRSVLFLALLNATSQRSVPFLALLGADVWWRCCCCWFVLPRCDAEWVRFFVAPLNGIRNFLSAKRRFEGGSNVVDVDDASKIGGKKSVKKSGGKKKSVQKKSVKKL